MVNPRLATPVRTPLEELVEEWLSDADARGVKPKALQLYRAALERLLAYCEARQITEPDGITGKVLNDYTVSLRDGVGGHGKTLSPASVHSYTRPINTFLRWAGRDPDAGVNGANVASLRGVRAQLIKPGKRTIPVLSREEIRDMEDAAGNERDKLIIRLLADTGIRLGELLALTEKRIVSTGGPRGRRFIRVLGKGDQERDVPVSPALYERLRRYASKTRPRDTRSRRLFLANRRDRRTKDFQPLTESGAEQMVRLTAEAAGIQRRVYPHLFRHSAATFLLKQKMNPIILADLLGHSSLKMIQEVYAHITPDDTYDALMDALTEDPDGR